MASVGRPRKKTGARNAKGRLVQAPDRGNIVVQARSAAFARFQGGKAGQQVHDQIGRAWAVGLLDGHACDAAILRDVGRRYGQLYWHRNAQLAPKVGQSERQGHGFGEGGSDAAEYAFNMLDALAMDAGRAGYSAMHALCVNQWWFPDHNEPWLDRLVNEALARRDGAVAGLLAVQGDMDRLKAAIGALLAMTGGNRDRRETFRPSNVAA